MLSVRNAILGGTQTKELYRSKERISPLKKQDQAEKSEPILLVINESWGVNGLKSYTEKSYSMPKVFSLLESRPDFRAFQNHFTNSTATELSLPSILTGVAPYESFKKIHTMPFIWDWAKAAGYKTYFFTSQRLKWANLDRYLNSPSLDVRYSAEESSLNVVNDYAVDEISFIKNIIDMDLIKQDEAPAFIVYFSGAMHLPFQDSSVHLKPEKSLTKHKKALIILDHALETLILEIEKKTKAPLKVIMTSDHGEHPSGGSPARINNYSDTILKIPLVTSGLSLDQNTDRLSENIDITKTLVKYWKLDQVNKMTFDKLLGDSLDAPAIEPKTVISLNVNSYRKWKNKAFAIITDSSHLTFNSPDKVTLIDRKTEGKENLWGKTDKTPWLEIIKSNPYTDLAFSEKQIN